VVKNRTWHTGNLVILGDAAHTAHYSIGSGTKLAIEDAISLAGAVLSKPTIPEALAAYEEARRPTGESLQRSAQVSLEWFESTPRYMKMEPLTFAMSLLTRSLRITHENLQVRDPKLIERVDARFAERAAKQSGRERAGGGAADVHSLQAAWPRDPQSRGALPMCQYSAEDGTIDDWHLVHLGSRAIGGAGLLITEMTDVDREGRITPGCAGMYKPEHVAALEADHHLRPQALSRQDRPPDRARGPQGLHAAHVGRDGPAPGAGRLAGALGLRDPLSREQPCPQGRGPRRHGQGEGRFRPRRRSSPTRPAST
jgi:anthraniloyl-CoA monooxygenase